MTTPFWKNRTDKFISRQDDFWVPSGRILLVTSDGIITSLFDDSPISILREFSSDGILLSDFSDAALSFYLLTYSSGIITSDFSDSPISILRELDSNGTIFSNFSDANLIIGRDLLARYIFVHPSVEKTHAKTKIFTAISEILDPRFVFSHIGAGDIIVVHDKITQIVEAVKVRKRKS